MKLNVNQWHFWHKSAIDVRVITALLLFLTYKQLWGIVPEAVVHHNDIINESLAKFTRSPSCIYKGRHLPITLIYKHGSVLISLAA